jgi:hypothetical protein
MQLHITLVKDNGEEVRLSHQLADLDSANVIQSVEQELAKLHTSLNPLLSEALLETHQLGFVGEKNQEEER